jgi:uncharacterized protein YjbI with pentapeptide repeats
MKLTNPQLPQMLTVPDDIIELFRDEDTISGVHLENTWLTTADLHKKSFSEARMTRVDFSQVHVARFDVLDCVFDSCNFTTSKFPESSWHRVLVNGARCSGLQMTNGIIRNVRFKNCKLEMVNFRLSRLENVIFEDCVIDDVDFYDAKLKNIEFINCSINEITFASARMVHVDISKSTVEGIRGINSLKGVSISYDQLMQLAPAFATEAGLKVV